jgi:hypothetical protein
MMVFDRHGIPMKKPLNQSFRKKKTVFSYAIPMFG